MESKALRTNEPQPAGMVALDLVLLSGKPMITHRSNGISPRGVSGDRRALLLGRNASQEAAAHAVIPLRIGLPCEGRSRRTLAPQGRFQVFAVL